MRNLLLILVVLALGLGALWWFQRPAAKAVASPPVPTTEASGWVRYPDGSPVGEGFEVAAFLEGVEPPVPVVSVTTNANGAFVLPASLHEGPPFVLDAAGKGWGTDRRTLSAAVGSAAKDVELTVQPLYAALLQTRAEAPGDGRTEFLGSAELVVPREVARRVNNWILQHRYGERGCEVRLYTPADGVNAPDAIEGKIQCSALDRPAPTAQAVLVPRWGGAKVVRLDSAPCWSNGPFETLRVSLSGGVGWELLEPSQVFATLELTSESRQILRAPISVADWRAGSAAFQVPRGTYGWRLVRSIRKRSHLAEGTCELHHGAAQIDIDLSGLGGLVFEVLEADGTAFTGPLRVDLTRIEQESLQMSPSGAESSPIRGADESDSWLGPPYVVLLLEPGEYLARMERMIVTYHSNTEIQHFGERAQLAAGELKTVVLHRSAPRN